MKKLMIATAIVCAAVMAQAAAFDWKTAKSGGAVNAPEGLTLAASTAYIFESTAASDIFAAFKAGTDWTTGALDSNAIAATGKITAKDTKFTYGGAGQAATLNAIFAFEETIGGTKYLYISAASGEVAGPATGSETVQFKEAGVSAAINSLDGGYKGAGWYAAVPEPTSGLLLLLGMAGLALKRKRA